MTTDTQTQTTATDLMDELFSVGAHYAYSKSRRHPSAQKYIFGAKDTVELFDLEKTSQALQEAQAFAKRVGEQGKLLLSVGGKYEAQGVIREVSEAAQQPFVVGRWIGGMLTNFDVIRKRVEKLMQLVDQREKGMLDKYTKKERVLFNREIDRLEEKFGGLRTMERAPGAMFVVDPKREHVAVKEAQDRNIPIIALASSDCDLSVVDYPIPANDTNINSISFIVRAILEAYQEGKKDFKPAAPKTEMKKESSMRR